MTHSAQLAMALLLAGPALSAIGAAPWRAARPDSLLVALATGGLFGFACALIAASAPS
jgi:hypothetical protein